MSWQQDKIDNEVQERFINDFWGAAAINGGEWVLGALRVAYALKVRGRASALQIADDVGLFRVSTEGRLHDLRTKGMVRCEGWGDGAWKEIEKPWSLTPSGVQMLEGLGKAKA